MTNVLFGFAECCCVENIIFKWKFFSLFFGSLSLRWNKEVVGWRRKGKGECDMRKIVILIWRKRRQFLDFSCKWGNFFKFLKIHLKILQIFQISLPYFPFSSHGEFVFIVSLSSRGFSLLELWACGRFSSYLMLFPSIHSLATITREISNWIGQKRHSK